MLGVVLAVGGFISFLVWAGWMLWRSYKGAQAQVLDIQGRDKGKRR